MDRQRRSVSKKTKSNKPKGKFKKLITNKYFIIVTTILVALFLWFQVIRPMFDKMRPLSFLVVGSDISEVRDAKFNGTKAEKTDSLMVVTFNPNTYTFEATSIPRDTAIDYKCEQEGVAEHRAKINELYATSGRSMNCLKRTISNFLNVPIDYYVKVNFDQFISLIDSVGPLKITVHAADGYLYQEGIDGTQSYSWKDGDEVEMMGDEALMYARARKDSERDYGRGIRQQQVIAAIVKNTTENLLNLNMVMSLI